MKERDLERVLSAAKEVAGGDEAKARSWMAEPSVPFGGKTPVMLVEEGRADDLVRYLQSLEGGPAG